MIASLYLAAPPSPSRTKAAWHATAALTCAWRNVGGAVPTTPTFCPPCHHLPNLAFPAPSPTLNSHMPPSPPLMLPVEGMAGAWRFRVSTLRLHATPTSLSSGVRSARAGSSSVRRGPQRTEPGLLSPFHAALHLQSSVIWSLPIWRFLKPYTDFSLTCHMSEKSLRNTIYLSDYLYL